MARPKRHHVDFPARKTVKEPTDVTFRTRYGERVDFIAKKPVTEDVEVSFMARNKRKK